MSSQNLQPMDRGAWRVQSMKPQREGQDWATHTHAQICIIRFRRTVIEVGFPSPPCRGDQTVLGFTRGCPMEAPWNIIEVPTPEFSAKLSIAIPGWDPASVVCWTILHWFFFSLISFFFVCELFFKSLLTIASVWWCFFFPTLRHVGSQLPTWGSNLSPLHWLAKFQPLDNKGRPFFIDSNR